MDSKISKEIAAYQHSKASALYQNKLTRETNKLLIWEEVRNLLHLKINKRK